MMKEIKTSPDPMDPSEKVIRKINGLITDADKDGVDVSKVSDGYHTFDELYHHRAILTALAFNAIELWDPGTCWKSFEHHDPNEPMYDGMFIVGMNTPYGQVSYHYDTKYWELFACKELERAPEFDGHTPTDVTYRLQKVAELLSVNM